MHWPYTALRPTVDVMAVHPASETHTGHPRAALATVLEVPTEQVRGVDIAAANTAGAGLDDTDLPVAGKIQARQGGSGLPLGARGTDGSATTLATVPARSAPSVPPAAIGNATSNATGRRVLELPITLHKLL